MFTLFCQYNENEWGTKQRTFMVIQKKKTLKISTFVFHRRKQAIGLERHGGE